MLENDYAENNTRYHQVLSCQENMCSDAESQNMFYF